MSGEIPAPEGIGKEARLQENAKIQDEILIYREGIKDNTSNEVKQKGEGARKWLTEKRVHSGWSPAIDYVEQHFWSKLYLPAGRKEQQDFLLAVNFTEPPSRNIEAIQKLTPPRPPTKVEAPKKSPERKSHTDAEKQAIVSGIVDVGSTRKFGRTEQWRLVKGVQNRLRALNVHEDWFSTEPEKSTPETFLDAYSSASQTQKENFQRQVDFTKPPKENAVALKELAPKTGAPIPKPESVPKVVAEAPTRPTETAKVISFEQRIDRIKGDSKYQDKHLEEVHKEAEKARSRREAQPSLNKKDQAFLEDAVNTSVEVREDLRKQAAPLEKFFPGAIDHLVYLYVQTERIAQFAQDLKEARGKSLLDRDLREVSGRMREVCGKTIVQGWAGNDRQRNELIKRGDYLSLGKPIYFDTSLVRREVLTENEIVNWTKGRLGIYDQFWTQEIVYGADKNEASLGFDNGYARFTFRIKYPDEDDLSFTKRVFAQGKETLEPDLQKAYCLFQTAKAQAHGICLHLSPEYLNALSEKTDKYLTTGQLPQGFEATKSVQKAIEEYRKTPQDIEAAAWARRALFSDWLALSLTNPDYMKRHFPEELSFCEAIRKGTPIEKAAP